MNHKEEGLVRNITITADELLEKLSTQPAIAAHQEYTYKQWLYLPSFPIDELEDRWQQTKGRVNCANPANSLPGEWFDIDVFEDDPIGSNKVGKVWDELQNESKYYVVFFGFMEPDELVMPNGRVLKLP